jgi:hypothetical protein
MTDLSCGLPGRVSIDDGGCPEEHTAYWTSDDEGRCARRNWRRANEQVDIRDSDSPARG